MLLTRSDVLLPLTFHWSNQVTVPWVTLMGRRIQFLMCLKAWEPEILVSSIDAYYKKRLSLQMRNLRFRDINNFGKINLFLYGALECKTSKSISFPLHRFTSHICTCTFIWMEHTEQHIFHLNQCTSEYCTLSFHSQINTDKGVTQC